MAKASILLKVLIITLFSGWVSIWLLKPTELWNRKWKGAEDSAKATVFGYNGLDFAVYTFPVIAVAILGFVYLELKSREQISRQRRSSIAAALSNPLVVNTYLGVLSSIEIIVVSFFILVLAWTFYTHISSDFKKMEMPKLFHLNEWQFKLYRMAIRCGLLSEVCLALLLLPVLRGMAVFRLLGIQFETSVRYHIWLGTAMLFFATLHGAGTLFIWGVKNNIQDQMWKWQPTGRIYLAGEITLVVGLVIWITSLPQVRRQRFEIFYYTHHLYIVFLVFFLFHGGDRHFYMVFPGIFLFGLDKLLRIIQSRPQTCILSARVYPSKAIELILPKDPSLKYDPTSILFMKIPSISEFQWHAFSITSSSSVDHNTMSVIFKCEGRWTNSLYNMIHAEPDPEADQPNCIPIAIEGPYGPASMEFLRYDSLLLVAGGIGVTPFLSILQEIASSKSSGRNKFPSRIQLIYTAKKCQDISLLNPILPLLIQPKVEQLHLKLKMFVTQEVQSGTAVGELLTEFSPVQTVNFDTKCASYAVYGVESLYWMAVITGFSSIVFLVFLSCFNHFFLPPAKKSSKQKTPSSLTDLLLICSFVITIICSSLVAVILRWKRLRKELPSISQKQGKGMKRGSTETYRALDEHEVHFGGRPNLQDVFSKFGAEASGSYIGVLVCGPETMKESVASLCQLNSQGFNKGANKKKQIFSFHSLNFTL